MINRFFLRIIAGMATVVVSEWLVPGVIFQYELLTLVKIAVIMALVNSLIKPVLKLIFTPVIILTLGLFTLAINFLMIWIVVQFAPEFSVIGLSAYFWTTIIAGVFNTIISASPEKEV